MNSNVYTAFIITLGIAYVLSTTEVHIETFPVTGEVFKSSTIHEESL